MLINELSNALIWLGGVLNILGLLGGMTFLALWLLGFVRVEKDEDRCHKCRNYDNCCAACGGYPGVSYPCANYERRKK